MTTIRPRLSNDDGDSNENGKKNLDGFRLFARASRFFVHFLAVIALLRHFLISRGLFTKLRYDPFALNPENFANIWQIKWKSNKVDEVWNSANLL